MSLKGIFKLNANPIIIIIIVENMSANPAISQTLSPLCQEKTNTWWSKTQIIEIPNEKRTGTKLFSDFQSIWKI